MTRSIIAVVFAGLGLAGVLGTGCSQTGVGDPCTPEQEYNTQFNGFDAKEVDVESKSFQCQTRLCLVNHFQGRVSCPYGQDSTGKGPDGASGCLIPGGTSTNSADKITGDPSNQTTGATVSAQCTDRTANEAVYCSCRCADINGTQNGGNFCTCPDGFACTQLVTSIGVGDTGLTGAYCVKNSTAFNATTSDCSPTGTNLCDASKKNCGALPTD